MGIGSRLARMKEAAEERGPTEAQVAAEAEGERSPEPQRFALLPPVAPEMLFPKSIEVRSAVANRCAGLDCETFLIQPGRATPRLVVTGYQSADGRQAIVTGDPHDPTVHARAFLAFTEAILREARALNHVGATHSNAPASMRYIGGLLVNQNIAFDFCAIAEDAHQADTALGLVGTAESWFEAVMVRIFEMLDAALVEDTMLRERLIDLAEGTLEKDFASLTAKGTPRRKSYTLKTSAKNYLDVDLDKITYRLGYSKYHNKTVDEYDEGAVGYLTDDVETALHVASRQQERAVAHGLPVGARIPNSAEQSKAAFALNLVSSWGMRTDLSKVQLLDADLDHAARSMLRVLQEHGLVRTKGRNAGTRDMKMVHKLVEDAYEKVGIEVPRTKTGRISTAGAVLEDIALIALRGSSDDVLDVDGRIDESELMKLPLYAYSQYSSIQKIQNTYLPVLQLGAQVPINTRFQTILETGRISSFKPNLNNVPRGGDKTLLARLQARVRQCFVPRPGFLFCSVDYNMLELCTLAQCLLWFFGESKMADAINAGFDLHTLFAAEQLLHIPYEECLARKKEKHVADMRQLAKCFHPDTEFLTRTGWKTYAQLSAGEEIVQASVVAGDIKMEWTVPFNLFTKRADKLVHLKNEGIDIRVTDDHRMLAFNAKRQPRVVSPMEFGNQRGWWNAGILDGGDESMDAELDLVRFAVATQADGSYGAGGNLRFGFSKKRKIQRFEELLVKMLDRFPNTTVSIRWHTPTNSKHKTSKHWDITGELAQVLFDLLPGKVFDWAWLDASLSVRQTILDEARYWDGSTPANGVAYAFTSTIRQNSEVLSAIASITGRKSRLITEVKTQPGHADAHKVTVRTKDDSRGDNVERTIEDYDGDVVCLSVPSSFVLVRSGGVPVITGQCGNFGLGGGMGAQSFTEFSKATYNVFISLPEAKALKEKWLAAWPEMRKYFKLIGSMMRGFDDKGQSIGDMEQFVSGRIRGRTRYCAMANGFFQSLAADGAKKALYEIQRASYLRGGRLYGSRCVAFFYDEFFMEHPEETASERGHIQAEMAIEHMQEVVPQVRIGAGPALMESWYKLAEEVYNKSGRLIPWKPKGEQTEDFYDKGGKLMSPMKTRFLSP